MRLQTESPQLGLFGVGPYTGRNSYILLFRAPAWLLYTFEFWPCDFLSAPFHLARWEDSPVHFRAPIVRGVVTAALGISGLPLSCCLRNCSTKEMSATSTPDEIWNQMTLFASKRRTKGPCGEDGVNRLTGRFHWSIWDMAGPGAPMARCWWQEAASNSTRTTMSLLFQGFSSSPYFSYFSPYSID